MAADLEAVTPVGPAPQSTDPYNVKRRGARARLNGTVSKTVVAFVVTVGSNPTLSAGTAPGWAVGFL